MRTLGLISCASCGTKDEDFELLVNMMINKEMTGQEITEYFNRINKKCPSCGDLKEGFLCLAAMYDRVDVFEYNQPLQQETHPRHDPLMVAMCFRNLRLIRILIDAKYEPVRSVFHGTPSMRFGEYLDGTSLSSHRFFCSIHYYAADFDINKQTANLSFDVCIQMLEMILAAGVDLVNMEEDVIQSSSSLSFAPQAHKPSKFMLDQMSMIRCSLMDKPGIWHSSSRRQLYAEKVILIRYFTARVFNEARQFLCPFPGLAA